MLTLTLRLHLLPAAAGGSAIQTQHKKGCCTHKGAHHAGFVEHSTGNECGRHRRAAAQAAPLTLTSTQCRL